MPLISLFGFVYQIYYYFTSSSVISDQRSTIGYLQDANTKLNQSLAKFEVHGQPLGGGRSNYTTFIQFAGFRRDAIVRMADYLASQGWSVPAAAKGGQRTDSADGVNEVRIGREEDRTNAKQVAEAILAIGLVKQQPTVKVVGQIPAQTLQVWVSP